MQLCQGCKFAGQSHVAGLPELASEEGKSITDNRIRLECDEEEGGRGGCYAAKCFMREPAVAPGSAATPLKSLFRNHATFL
jgi:hypothetical protein